MNIDLNPPELWPPLCNHLSALMKTSKEKSLRIYNGSYSALFELSVPFAKDSRLRPALEKAWSRNAALEKAATGLGSLEASTRKMTGGKLDY